MLQMLEHIDEVDLSANGMHKLLSMATAVDDPAMQGLIPEAVDGFKVLDDVQSLPHAFVDGFCRLDDVAQRPLFSTERGPHFERFPQARHLLRQAVTIEMRDRSGGAAYRDSVV